MNRQASHYATLLVFATALIVALLCSLTFAQDPPREKPRLKDFGSSLKRLKWDQKQSAAVEDKRREVIANKSAADDVVRVETSLVVSDVLVLDQHGRPVQGLTRKDFVITEDGKPQQIGMLSLGDDAKVPRSIVLIIDYSCSQLPFLDSSIEAAKTLVAGLGPLDRMAVVTDDIELLVGFTTDKNKLKKKLDEVKRRTVFDPGILPDDFDRRIPFGRGFEYSALMAVLKEAFDDEDVRPIIIFQTDGGEASILKNPIVTPSIPPGLPSDWAAEGQANLARFQGYVSRNPREFSLADVYRAAEKSHATIYTVVPGFRLIGLSPEEQTAQTKAYLERRVSYLTVPMIRKRAEDRLKRMPVELVRNEAEARVKLQSALAVLSTVTGGWIDFFSQPDQAAGIYAHIFSDINRRYLIGYYPINKEHDGKRRKVNVEVRGHPEYVVMGRKAYLAPEPER
ncbi:MAG TPA: VWA domain-containing protein [Pyrinomonadaceae bacterium]|nr:VWA domain-containing protein [Pyrinomonadaceae bacterium]